MYLHKSITKIDTITKIVSLGKVPIQRLWVELSKDKDFVDATINTITHRHIDQPISASNRYLVINKHEDQNMTCMNNNDRIWHPDMKHSHNYNESDYETLEVILNRHHDMLTAGFARCFVRGNSRVPAPPPRMMDKTDLESTRGFSTAGSCRNKKG